MLSLDLNSKQLQQGGGSGRAGLALGFCWAAVPYLFSAVPWGWPVWAGGWCGEEGSPVGLPEWAFFCLC